MNKRRLLIVSGVVLVVAALAFWFFRSGDGKNKLQFETDVAQRAVLANQIVQMSIDSNAFGYVGLFNKVSVAKPGVTGFSENIPFDFYGLTADTDIA